MSRHADVATPFGDGEYTFRLGIGELRKLQERTNAGPYELLGRMARGTWRVDDVREAIRLGLQGGRAAVVSDSPLDDQKINRLIRDYVDERPLLQSVALAARILEAALSGAPDDELPKSTAAETEAPGLKTASSPSPPSTDGARSSATRRRKSTLSRSGSLAPASPDTVSPMALK